MKVYLIMAGLIVFSLAMLGYGAYLCKIKRPLSYFDLRDLGRVGDRWAGAIFVVWNLALVELMAFVILNVLNIV
jgi:hypothetical protein